MVPQSILTVPMSQRTWLFFFLAFFSVNTATETFWCIVQCIVGNINAKSLFIFV